MNAVDQGEEIRRLARNYARERYLAALLAPRPVRDDLVALAAFTGEMARIVATVSEPALGEIRLQWWRDQLDRWPGDDRCGHPLADRLAKLAGTHGLAATLFHPPIDARSFDFSAAAMPDTHALETYLAKVEGTGFALAARLLEARDAGRYDGLARRAGFVYGLARRLSAWQALGDFGHRLLPHDRLADSGGETELCEELERETASAWQALRSELDGVPAMPRLAFLPLALTDRYLALCKQNRVGASERGGISPLAQVWRIWRAKHRGFAA